MKLLKRKTAQAWWQTADWTKRNIDIAKKHGITRERARQVRAALGRPKVGRTGPPKCK